MSSRAALMLALLCATGCGLALAHSAPNSLIKLAFATAAEHESGPFTDYLLRHLAAETPQGAAWKVEVRSVSNVMYLDHAYLSARVEFTPPPGASARAFVLIDDAVTHEVRNHVVLVVARGGATPEVLGALQYPARRLVIDRPLTAARK